MSNYTVNEQGLTEIKEFLSNNHKKGGDHFTAAMLRAWAADAEFQLAEGNQATIEIKSWDSIHGRTQEFTISETRRQSNDPSRDDKSASGAVSGALVKGRRDGCN